MFTPPDETARAHAFMQALDATLETGHTSPDAIDTDLLHVAQQLAAADYSAESRSRVEAPHWFKARSQKEKTMSIRHLPRPVRIALASAAALVMVTTAFLAIPPLRSWAQDVIEDLFNRNDDDTWIIMNDIPPTSMWESIGLTFSSIEEAEQALEQDILTPVLDVRPYVLDRVTYSVQDRYISLIYSAPGRGITINTFPPDYSGVDYGRIGPNAEIISVSFEFLGEQVDGAYAEGSWIIPRNGYIPFPAEGGIVTQEAQWLDTASRRQLRWRFNDWVYHIDAMGGSDERPAPDLDLESLVAIAESMQ